LPFFSILADCSCFFWSDRTIFGWNDRSSFQNSEAGQFMARRPGEIGKRRREQIIDAAVAIIDERGLQHLSLSAIEKKAGMSRGQLTYYFPAKEEILLAVFDRMIETMHRRAHEGNSSPGCAMAGTGWQRVRGFLGFFLLQPPDVPEFHALQYTFLSQVGHRDDYRSRLASLYEEWRTHLAGDFAADLGNDRPRVSARTLATLVQALLHGLAIQRVADPTSYNRNEMLTLCVELLRSYLGKTEPSPPAPEAKKASANGAGRVRTKRANLPG
jgi:AcrR family transcriptional regulator